MNWHDGTAEVGIYCAHPVGYGLAEDVTDECSDPDAWFKTVRIGRPIKG